MKGFYFPTRRADRCRYSSPVEKITLHLELLLPFPPLCLWFVSDIAHHGSNEGTFISNAGQFSVPTQTYALTALLHCTSHTDRSDRNSIWFWFSNIDCVRTGGDVDQQEVRTNRTTTTRLNLAIEKKGNSHTFGQFAFLIDGYECILRCRWRWKKISKTVSGISSNFLEYHLIWHTENELISRWQFCEISPSKTSSNFAQLMILILWCASTIAGFYKELVTQLPSSFFCFFTWQRCRFNLSFTN